MVLHLIATNITIPNTIVIGINAFSGCTNLADIKIPNNLIITEQGVFNNTAWLNNKISQNSLVIINNVIIDGTTATGDIIIPEGVIAIANYAFSKYNSGLTSITMPSSVTYIGINAFFNCNTLTNAIFKDTSDWYVGYSTNEIIKQIDFSNNKDNVNYLYDVYFSKCFIKK